MVKTAVHDPSAMEVINSLIDPNAEQKASKYMKGHID